MLNKIIVNWKTSSAGIFAILGAIISIVYSINDDGRIGESELITQLSFIFAGIGLLLSRDIGISTERENGRADLEDVGERTDANK